MVSEFGDIYPELKEKEAFVIGIIKDEEEAFSSMLVRGGRGGRGGVVAVVVGGGRGAYSFVACPSRLAIDYAFLSRRTTIPM